MQWRRDRRENRRARRWWRSGKGGGRGRGGDVPVTVANASHRDVPLEIQVIGNVEAYSTITVKAQVGGQLVNVYFKEGDFVKKGEKLFDIDPRPLEAAYNQVVANIARDRPRSFRRRPTWRAMRPTPNIRTPRPSATPNCFRPASFPRIRRSSCAPAPTPAPRPSTPIRPPLPAPRPPSAPARPPRKTPKSSSASPPSIPPSTGAPATSP